MTSIPFRRAAYTRVPSGDDRQRGGHAPQRHAADHGPGVEVQHRDRAPGRRRTARAPSGAAATAWTAPGTRDQAAAFVRVSISCDLGGAGGDDHHRAVSHGRDDEEQQRSNEGPHDRLEHGNGPRLRGWRSNAAAGFAGAMRDRLDRFADLYSPTRSKAASYSSMIVSSSRPSASPRSHNAASSSACGL